MKKRSITPIRQQTTRNQSNDPSYNSYLIFLNQCIHLNGYEWRLYRVLSVIATLILLMRKTHLVHRQLTLLGRDSFVLGALATHLKAHAMIKCIQLPDIYSSLKKDLHNIPTHCEIDYLPKNMPLKNQNCVIMCPKDEQDVFECSKWYATECTDPLNVPPLFILCENLNFSTVLASLVVKKFITEGCSSTVPKSVIGVPTFTVYRTRGFLANTCRRNPYDIDVNLAIGGTPQTAVPLTAAIGYHCRVHDLMLHDVTRRVQNYPLKSVLDDAARMRPEETMYTAFSKNSPNTVAFAGFEFVISFLRAQRGDGPATEVVFTEQFHCVEDSIFSEKKPAPKFLSRRAMIEPSGLTELHTYGKLSDFEREEAVRCIPALQDDIQLAEKTFEKLTAALPCGEKP